MDDEWQSNIQRSLQYEIGKLSCAFEEEELRSRGPNDESSVTISREGIAALTELTYQFAITSFANDLASFSAHGNRSIINGRDVKLALRKAPCSIRDKFDNICAENKLVSPTTTGQELKMEKKMPGALSKVPADKNQGSSFTFKFDKSSSEEIARENKEASPFDFNFEESSSDETAWVKKQHSPFNFEFEESSSDDSHKSEIYSNVRAYRRSRNLSSASSSSSRDDSSGVSDDYENVTKRRSNGRIGDNMVPSIDDCGCIELLSD